MIESKPDMSIYNPFKLYDEEEDVNCHHDQVETLIHSFKGDHLWKCSKCGKRFTNQEIEARKEEYKKNQP
ncbi:hypothetical protein NQ810_13970 [Acinetobacter baumannii]|uniref:hypothetical protein n=1 Tax=Acinetobacter calcoaceticus/baumannii complex TaxID=909768 RepID=UPI0005C61A94|nr:MULTISPECIES: hypothetical protein [Acinetobacter calcoaceticus/baumannii complex]MBK5976683.1 hypothetical protein [Acinetobacter baumannii]MDC4739039.1 hypothetical protein [Acinetobacter baumannii]